MDRWYSLYIKSKNYCDDLGITHYRCRVMDIYIKDTYNAIRVNRDELYEFDSTEKYTEFLLTWL